MESKTNYRVTQLVVRELHLQNFHAGPCCVRGVKISKGYIVVYVCLSTRAIHLEVASDMSTNTFISSLKRFVSRRCYPNEICSDNDINFIGVDRVLRDFIE